MRRKRAGKPILTTCARPEPAARRRGRGPGEIETGRERESETAEEGEEKAGGHERDHQIMKQP